METPAPFNPLVEVVDVGTWLNGAALTVSHNPATGG